MVVVGAGHAGGRAAERLRFNGYAGAITLVGGESHRPYERPPLSKGVLTADRLAAPPFLMDQDNWDALAVDFLNDRRCLSIDRTARRVTLSGGEVLAYEHLILATGLTQRRLPQLDAVDDRVLTLHSYDEACTLRERLGRGVTVALIGAGFIGLEVAASARQRGAEVLVIEAADRPLARALPAALSAWVGRLHRGFGVDLRCGRQILSAEVGDRGVRIGLAGGEACDADFILCGIGGRPNDDLARQAGLRCSDGVEVDQGCRTSDPRVFAIGDIACMPDPYSALPRRLESWKNAEETAAVAAANICGRARAYTTAPWFWTDQYGLNIQFTGDLGGQGGGARSLLQRGQVGEPGYLAYLLDGEMLIGAFGIDCGGDIRRARGLLEKGGEVTDKQLRKAGVGPLEGGVE
ncbi:MAG: FAD-dependent oxidoreductase [Rhodospirillales bacterium]